MDERINTPWSPNPKRTSSGSRLIRITRPNPRKDPFLEPAVVDVAAAAVVAAQAVVGVVVQAVDDRTAMAGTGVGSAVVVGRMTVVSGSLYDRTAKVIDSEIAAKE